MSSSIGWVNAIIRGGSGIVATIANVIIIYLGVRSKKFLTNYTNFTIFFLAVADFIFGFGAILRCINDLSPVLVDFGNTYQYNICSALLTPQVWSYQLRQLIVLFVALDMFCAIRFPFRYRLVPIRTKILYTCFVSICYATISMTPAYLTRQPFTTRICKIFYVFDYNYMLFYVGNGFLVTTSVVTMQVANWIMSHKKDNENMAKHSTHDNRNFVSEYSKVKKSITYVLINFFFLWAMPQMILFIFLLISVPQETASETIIIQNHMNSWQSAVNIFIYLKTYPAMRILFNKHILMKHIHGEHSNSIPINHIKTRIAPLHQI